MRNVKRRTYRQTTRAARVAETRQRIVDAAIELHTTVGPARTSLSQVANKAGVSRPTLYAHFPDEVALLRACTHQSLASDPPPDPDTWAQLTPAEDRVRQALTELYEYFERTESLTANVIRDMAVVPAMRELNAPIFEAAFAVMREVLVAGFGDRSETRRARRSAAAAVALAFPTWQILVRQRGLASRQAVELMAGFVESV